MAQDPDDRPSSQTSFTFPWFSSFSDTLVDIQEVSENGEGVFLSEEYLFEISDPLSAMSAVYYWLHHSLPLAEDEDDDDQEENVEAERRKEEAFLDESSPFNGVQYNTHRFNREIDIEQGIEEHSDSDYSSSYGMRSQGTGTPSMSPSSHSQQQHQGHFSDHLTASNYSSASTSGWITISRF